MKIKKLNVQELDILTELYDYNDVEQMLLENAENIRNGSIDIFLLYDKDTAVGELHVMYESDDENFAVRGRRAYLFALRVRQELQNKGYGTYLLKEVLSILEENGYCEFTVGVEDDNFRAKHIYQACGFDEFLLRKQEEYQGDFYEYDLYLKSKAFCLSDRTAELSYKKATKDDIEPIYELCKQLIDKYEQTDAIDYPKVLNWVRKKIESSVDEYTAVYANGVKAAYYHFYKNEKAQFEIDDLYVFTEFRNKGIGSAVIKKCCMSVDEPVILYVFIGNERAVSLYKRLGFTVIETIGDSRYIMRSSKEFLK